MEVDLLVLLPWVNQSAIPGGPRTTRCTDVLGSGVMGHNEDNDAFFGDLCFLVTGGSFFFVPNCTASLHVLSPLAFPDPGHYTSFNYPAQLAGNAFGWSARGVVVSINQLAPIDYVLDGAGFYFLTRDALEAASVGGWRSNVLEPSRSCVRPASLSPTDDAIGRLTRHAAFSGFSANVGSASAGPVNLEVAGAARVVTPAPLAHFNEYERLPAVRQLPDVSSQARAARWAQMGRPSQPLSSALAFLSDQVRGCSSRGAVRSARGWAWRQAHIFAFLCAQHNVSYPVYRQDDATGESTLATMGADLVGRSVRVYTGKPDSTEPAYTFVLS